ncbi:DUF6526 family protein [Paenibacillus sp. OV219]|uniref:DUF6526 family protein n=1 Tax=Paenibacillus sp. OV219 TaxID=1884377 RepID=UPI0008CA5DC9|nr:DUF6526 family protein [Paenibacillus sp. OV219]SEM58319.1 hypothetical protein SAMN05518847_101223 [Paenibacillus sp. OV219]
MSKQVQNYQNHRRFHPPFHFVLTLLNAAFLISAIWELVRTIKDNGPLLPAVMFVLLALISLFIFLIIRSYPLKAQDRAIRSEENLRHYVLTGKLLDSRLTLNQTLALRFAPDAEFPALCNKAAAEQLTPDMIKRSIKSWRSDNDRI